MSLRSKNVDRLISMPDEILSRILSLIPMKSAVQTSTLSKQWRHIWTLSANLDFDFDNMYDHDQNFDINRLLKTVNGVFELCKSSQVKLFRLHVSEFLMPDCVWLKWINEAVRLNVGEIDIKAKLIKLPLSLFSCNTLTKLSLRLVESNIGNLYGLDVPSNVKLPSLKTLDIHDTIKPSVSALRLIHGCPMLESLSLLIVSGEEYNFNIPTLKRLKIQTYELVHSNSNFRDKVVLNVPSLESLCFYGGLSFLFVMENLSSLVEATVSISTVRSNHLMAQLLKGISGVKSLSWFISTLDVFLDARPPKFRNLKHLDFQGSYSRWLQVIEILERCSELEHLRICGPKESCWIEPQLVKFSNLKTLKFSKCMGRKCDIEFLEYMLGNAEVLKKITITCASYIDDEMRLCAALLKFPRASRSCEIHFVGKRVNSQNL